MAHIAPAFRITLVMTILTGLIYPALVTGVAQVAVSFAGERVAA